MLTLPNRQARSAGKASRSKGEAAIMAPPNKWMERTVLSVTALARGRARAAPLHGLPLIPDVRRHSA